MKRFTGHKEQWGDFVDVKVNAANLLRDEIRQRQAREVWISGVCDPYQPLEEKYELTRKCLEILSQRDWPVTIQTKSSLVLRDKELLRRFSNIEVGFTITTADENIRKIFEPNSTEIRERIEALKKLHSAGLKTYAMTAPVLPKVEGLATSLKGIADYILIDKMNYHYADWVYKKHGLEYAMTDSFFRQKKAKLARALENEKIPHRFLF